MSYITRSRVLNSSMNRAWTTARAQHARSVTQVRLAHQGYGTHKGSHEGKIVSKRGTNPSAEIDHSGALTINAGYVPAGFVANSTSEGRKTSIQFGPGSQKRQISTTTVFSAEKKPKSTEGLEPKILNERAPTSNEESQEVKQHNKEFENRAERAHESLANEDTEKDKVSSKFWSEDKDDKTGGRSKENA